ncbi:DUF4115 domain-containing protein, partial [Bacteroidota bacterium]
IYMVIVLAFILVVYFSLFDNGDFSSEGQASETGQTEETDTVIIKPDGKGLFSFYEEPDSIILIAHAKDSAWLKITIDGKTSEYAYMYPNLEKRWSASEFFLLTLGNAGAVEFKRNGELLPKLGAYGTVVRNIKITATEVVNSSDPWNDSTLIAERRRRNRRRKAAPDPSKSLEKATVEKTVDNLLKDLKPAKETAPFFKKEKEEFKPIEPKINTEEKKPSGLENL